MMQGVFARIARYGREITVVDEQGGEVVCRGFLQPVDTMEERFPEDLLPCGDSPQARYFLLAAPEAVRPGQTAAAVRWGGRVFDVLGMKEIFCGEERTHWEGVLRERGEAAWN